MNIPRETRLAVGTNPAWEWVRDNWDADDTWGSAMSTAYAVCDFLRFTAGGTVPDSLGYHPSMGGPDEDSYEYQALMRGSLADAFTVADLEGFANALSDYLDALEAAGYDY